MQKLVANRTHLFISLMSEFSGVGGGSASTPQKVLIS